MEIPSSKNNALHNIPQRKVQEKINSILRGCSICSAKQVSDGLCSTCSLKVTAINRYFESNIPAAYWGLDMKKNFSGDPGLLSKYQQIIGDLSIAYQNGMMICFAGSHGVGKTMALSSILKKVVQQGYSAIYSTLSDIVSVLTSAPSDQKFEARQLLATVDFLVIDECDVRFFTTDSANELYGRTLETFLRSRQQNNLPIFMATNSPNFKEMFSSYFKDSLSSLMAKKLEFFVVMGEDYRKKVLQ